MKHVIMQLMPKH